MTNLKTISLASMVILYIGAGFNHFIHPATYYAIIPPYLPYHYLINCISGIAEIILGSLLLFSKTRRAAAYCIIGLLILFIPAHIYMIQKSGCGNDQLCVKALIAWIRFPLQFILIWWAWSNRK